MANPLQTFVAGLLGSAAPLMPKAFEAGQNNRRLAAIPTNTLALNTLILKYGRTVLARSRYLCMNNAYTLSAKETFVSALVGTGIRPSTLGETKEAKKQVHEDFADWALQSDADGLTNFYGQQETGASELFEAGEFFIHMRTGAQVPESGVVPLKLKLIPSEMLPYENYSTEPVAPGNVMQMGIEFDAEGNRVAYHFLTVNPTDITRTDSVQWKRVRLPAEDVIHVYRPLRIGQIRGIPQTLASLVSSAMLDLYDDAELERKRTAALFAAFVTKKSEDDDGPLGASTPVNAGSLASGNTTPEAFNLQPGIVVDLLPGEDIKFSQPADVGGGYDPFQYRMLCRLAAGFGVPYASMSGDLKAANYGSIRAGLVQFRRRIEMMQFNTLIPQLCGPVWVRWLRIYTFTGLAPWPAADWVNVKLRRVHMRVKWLCPRWDWVDPLKDAQAEKLLVDNGFKSRWDTVEETGADPSETDERIKEAQDSETELGLELNTGAVPPPIAPDESTADPSNPQEKPSAQ